MAWPLTPLLTFLRRSPPVVTADFLNELQTTFIQLFTGTISIVGIVIDGIGGQSVTPTPGGTTCTSADGTAVWGPGGGKFTAVHGDSPGGKVMKFQHRSAYDDIDSTYEAITAYLDEKGLEAKNMFAEEYLNRTKASDDNSLEVDIYVFLK